MPLVSKNGTDFFEIKDDENEMKIAESKGYKPYMEVTKNGKDVFKIEANADEIKTALDKGYYEKSAFNRMQTARKSDMDKISPLKSAVQGAASSMSWGLDDEVIGAINTVYDDVKGAFTGEKGKSFEENRDEIRENKKRLQEANPLSYFTGSVGGGLATPGAFAGKAATLGGQIVKGAASGAVGGGIQGFGDSTGENIEEIAKDTAKSAAIGGAFGGALGAFIKPKKLADKADEVADSFKTAKGGFIEGVKKESLVDDLSVPEWSGIPMVNRIIKGSKNTINAIKDKTAKSGEFKAIISKAKDEIVGSGGDGGGPHGPSFMDDLPDEHFALLKLLEDGDNEVKQFFAKKAATLYPGQVDAELYQKILKNGINERVIARALDKKEVAKELKPLFESTEKLFINARDVRFNQLQDQARKGYQDNSFDFRNKLSSILEATEDSNAPSELKRLKNPIKDVQLIIEEGRGMPSSKLKEGSWSSIKSPDRFNRLQAARKEIDSNIPWDRIKMGKKPTAGERELMNLREEIDSLLKVSPEKMEADSLFRESKNLENKFFDIVDYKGEVDEQVIARLFNDNDKANRFQNYMGELEEFINRPDLPSELKENGTELLNKLKQTSDLAQKQRDINAFRYKQGPSSPAIERQTSVLNKSRPLQEAMQSPSGFINAADQFMPSESLKRFGKQWNELNDLEKVKLIKLWTWAKSNPDALESDWDKVWKKLR